MKSCVKKKTFILWFALACCGMALSKFDSSVCVCVCMCVWLAVGVHVFVSDAMSGEANGEIDMQGDEEETNNMQEKSQDNGNNARLPTSAKDTILPASTSNTVQNSSEKPPASTHILCNGFAGPLPVVNGHSAGEGEAKVDSDSANMSPVDSKPAMADMPQVAGGDLALADPAAITDTDMEHSDRLATREGVEVEREECSLQRDSGFGSTSFDLARMDSVDSQGSPAPSNGEYSCLEISREIEVVCFFLIKVLRCLFRLMQMSCLRTPVIVGLVFWLSIWWGGHLLTAKILIVDIIQSLCDFFLCIWIICGSL